MNVKISGESFITPGELSELISQAVQDELGVTPETTTGGTSDARFVKNLCPVTEFDWSEKQCMQLMNGSKLPKFIN